jgi:hypothetical protein
MNHATPIAPLMFGSCERKKTFDLFLLKFGRDFLFRPGPSLNCQPYQAATERRVDLGRSFLDVV